MQYGLTPSKDDFKGVVRNPKRSDLDKVFDGWKADVVFFGHDHASADTQGKARYINPRSLGCYREALARYIIAAYDNDQAVVRNRSVKFDDKRLFDRFEERNLPARAFIYKVFFGSRFGP
jgi:predicted phosphodiesterase